MSSSGVMTVYYYSSSRRGAFIHEDMLRRNGCDVAQCDRRGSAQGVRSDLFVYVEIFYISTWPFGLSRYFCVLACWMHTYRGFDVLEPGRNIHEENNTYDCCV